MNKQEHEENEQLTQFQFKQLVLSTQELIEHRSQIARVSGTNKLRKILDSPSPLQVIQSMPPQELLYSIKDIGLADCAEIVQLAKREQLQSCFDLDLWKKDKFDLEKLTEWLQFLIADEVEAAESVLAALDSEQLILYLRSFYKIHDRPEDDEVNIPTTGELIHLSDLHYIIEVIFPPEDSMNVLARTALELFQRYGFEFYQKLFESIRWGISSTLEEEAYQFRKSRLTDLGFIDYYEALSIYSPLKAGSKPKPAYQQINIDVPLLPISLPPKKTGPFAQAFSEQSSQTQERLQLELLLLTNKGISAEQVDPSSPFAIQQMVRSIQQLLDIGIEICQEQGIDIHESLLNNNLEWLFRKAYTELAKLRKQAARISKDKRMSLFEDRSKGSSLLQEPYVHVLRNLKHLKPRYHTSLNPKPGKVSRPFRSLEEIKKTAEVLQFVRFLPTLFFEQFGFSHQECKQLEEQIISPHSLEDIGFSHLFLTALVQYSLSGSFVPEPITPEQIQEFLQIAFQTTAEVPHPISKSFKQKVTDTLMQGRKHTEQEKLHLVNFLDQIWQQLIDEVGYLPLDQKPDPRFIQLFLIKAETKAE